MADGEVLIPVNLQIDEAQKKLEALAKQGAKTKVDIGLKATELERARLELERLEETYSKLQTQVGGMQRVVNGKVVRTDSYDADVIRQFGEVGSQLSGQREVVAQLEDEYDKLNAQLEDTLTKIAELSGSGQKSALQVFADRFQQGAEQIGKGSNTLGRRLAGLARRVFVFSVVTSALRSVRTAFASLITSDDALNESLQQLKGNLLTLAAPLVNVLIPAFRTLVAVVNLLIQQIGSLIFSIFGINWGDAQASAKNMAKSFGASAGSAKEIQKSLAGIDEINRLDSPSSGGGGGGVGGGGLSFDTQQITDKLLEIEAIALGATLALGIILVMTGANMQLGLGLIVLGALGLVSEMKANWNSASDRVRDTLGTIVAIASGMLLALGILILVTTGSNPKAFGIGLALAVAGVAGKVSAFAFSWTDTSDKVKTILTKLGGVIAGAMLVLGVMFMLAGPATFGKGLALVAGSIGVGAFAFKFDWIAENVSNVFSKVKDIASRFGEWYRTKYGEVKMDFFSGVTAMGDKWKAFTELLREKLANAWAKIKQAFTNGGEIFGGIKDGISETFKRIVNGLISGINAVIAVPFRAINNALARIRDISIAGLTPFAGRISLISIPKIPQLAQGTVVPPNRQFLAMLGDNKTETEVVSPLSTMKEALAEALAESNQHITVNIDGRQLFDIIVGQNNAEVRRTGQTPLMV